MQIGIMSPPVSIDVRDMLCAQALAIVAQAMTRLAHGAQVELRYNTEDVKRDLLAWANDRGYGVDAAGTDVLRIEKR